MSYAVSFPTTDVDSWIDVSTDAETCVVQALVLFSLSEKKGDTRTAVVRGSHTTSIFNTLWRT